MLLLFLCRADGLAGSLTCCESCRGRCVCDTQLCCKYANEQTGFSYSALVHPLLQSPEISACLLSIAELWLTGQPGDNNRRQSSTCTGRKNTSTFFFSSLQTDRGDHLLLQSSQSFRRGFGTRLALPLQPISYVGKPQEKNRARAGLKSSSRVTLGNTFWKYRLSSVQLLNS